MNNTPLLIAGLIWLCTAATGWATSPISNVGGTAVTEGRTEIDYRMGYTTDDQGQPDDGRFQMRQHLDHGFTDWYAMRFVAVQDERHDDNMEHRLLRWEHRFHLIKQKDFGWDGGLRFRYDQSDGDKAPNEIHFRLLADIPFAERWNYRHNTILEHDVGENSRAGLTLELRHQITYQFDLPDPLITQLRMGVDVFNGFGHLRDLSGYEEQNHQIGPVMKFSLAHGLASEISYRAGISSEATDNLFKFTLAKRF